MKYGPGGSSALGQQTFTMLSTITVVFPHTKPHDQTEAEREIGWYI